MLSSLLQSTPTEGTGLFAWNVTLFPIANPSPAGQKCSAFVPKRNLPLSILVIARWVASSICGTFRGFAPAVRVCIRPCPGFRRPLARAVEKASHLLQRGQSIAVHEGHHVPIMNRAADPSDSFPVGNKPLFQTRFILDKAMHHTASRILYTQSVSSDSLHV